LFPLRELLGASIKKGNQCLSRCLRGMYCLGKQATDRFGAWLASMVGLALLGTASCIIAAAGAQTELMAGRTLRLASELAVPGTWPRSTPARRRSAGSSGRRSDRVSDARLQHRAAGRRHTHARIRRVIFWLSVLLMLAAVARLASAGSATARADGMQRRRAD
jgi:hypothetical protein